MKKLIKVACFALQGFGNDLLETLHEHEQVRIVAIYTREPKHPFAYYPCDTLEVLARKMKVPISYVSEKGEWDCVSADLAISSTFHRIFGKKHLSKYNFIINIHPSLLPGYKGATPTNWMVRNAEQIAGVTAHIVDGGIDTGPLLFQRRVLNPYLCDNELRRVLSFISRDVVNAIIDQYPEYKPREGFGQRDSNYPARSNNDSIIRIEELRDISDLISHIKAFTNYPMPKIDFGGKLFVIDYEQPAQCLEITLEGQSFFVPGYWSD